MAPSKQLLIPPSFNWLLPGQGLVAGVAIYSSIYVFGVGDIAFILAVVAAGLHFVLGIYFCFTKSRLRAHDLFLVPIWLIICAGVWTGSLYYFARGMHTILRVEKAFGSETAASAFESTGKSQIPTWTKVGTAVTGLNVFIDLALLTIFLLAIMRKPPPGPQPESYNTVSTSAYPPVAPISVPYQPPQQQPQQQQYYQMPVVSLQQQLPRSIPQRIVSSTSSDFKTPLPSIISPTTSPSPSQQYQQPQPQFQQPQQYPQQQQQQQPPQFQPSHQYQYQYQQHPQQPQPPSPPLAPLSAQPQPPSPYETHNRIEAIRRLCALQHPSGTWEYTPELAALLKLWGSNGSNQVGDSADLTALTHACLADLCNYVWSAQREGREHIALSAAELASLQGVGWDLGWARYALERAGGL